jgi:methionyl-tRNA formyltransferase
MARLRVALFGSSSNFSADALRELASAHDVVAVVRPARQGLRRALREAAGIDDPAPLEARARELRVPVLTEPKMGVDFRERIGALRPDLICIALFPRRVPVEVTGIAPLGAINVHPSILPRHRGPLPLFWTYHADDRRAGVTVHHATERFDAGDIILQECFELPRAYPVALLDRDVALRAARMLREAADALARGSASRTRQDESAATYAPFVRRGVPMVPFEDWDVERVWHFLAGLCPPYCEPLRDTEGRLVAYERVTGYRRVAPALLPGRLERHEGGLLLHCRDGIVELV